VDAIRNLTTAGQGGSYELSSFTLEELLDILPAHPQLFHIDPHEGAAYFQKAAVGETPRRLFEHTKKRRHVTIWTMIVCFDHHWMTCVFFEAIKTVVLVNSVPGVREDKAQKMIWDMLEYQRPDLGAGWRMEVRPIFDQRDIENCGLLAFTFVRELVRWLVGQRLVRVPARIDIARLRETFARRLALRSGLKGALLHLAPLRARGLGWAPAERRCTVEELMSELGVEPLALPGSQLSSPEAEDDDLRILDPSDSADLVQYHVLGNEGYARYTHVQFRNVAFEEMMTQVAARRHTVVRLLEFSYGEVVIRPEHTPREVSHPLGARMLSRLRANESTAWAKLRRGNSGYVDCLEDQVKDI
jgi:hypothetical protein